GLAGSFDKNIRIGEVMNITEDCFPELGAEDNEAFLSVFDLKLQDPGAYPFEKGIIRNETVQKNGIILKLKQARGITVNTVHGKEESIKKTVKRLSPQTESMEGAAFLFACRMENI